MGFFGGLEKAWEDAKDIGRRNKVVGAAAGLMNPLNAGSLNLAAGAAEGEGPRPEDIEADRQRAEQNAFQKERAHQDYLKKMQDLEGDVASVKWHSSGRKRNFAGQTDTDIRRQLNQGLTDITYNANKRGLLGSGLQKAAEGQAIGKAGSAYDEAVAKYNKQDEDLVNAYDQALLEAKQSKYADDTQAAELAYKKSLDKAQRWEEGRKNIFSGVGSILGGFLGRG